MCSVCEWNQPFFDNEQLQGLCQYFIQQHSSHILGACGRRFHYFTSFTVSVLQFVELAFAVNIHWWMNMNLWWSLFLVICLWSAVGIRSEVDQLHPDEAIESSNFDDADAAATVALDSNDKFDLPSSITESRREKRFVITLAAAASVAGIASALFGGGSFIYGIVNGQQKLGELRAIRRNVEELNRKVDAIRRDINDLKLGQAWIQAAAQYSKYTQRIDYFRTELAHMQIQANGKVGTTAQSNTYQSQVLGVHHVYSANECLQQIHNMIMGTSSFFPGRSIVDIFKQSAATTDQQTQRWFVQSYINRLVGLQLAGYTAWYTALNMASREGEVTARQVVMNQRFTAQKALFDRVIGQSADIYSNNGWGDSYWRSDRYWDHATVPSSFGQLRPLRGCGLTRKGNRVGLRCEMNNLRSTKGGLYHPDVTGYNMVTNGHWGSYTTDPKYLHTAWTMVPNAKDWTVCGAQIVMHGNRLALKIAACTKNMSRMVWINPSGWGNDYWTKDKYVDSHMITPKLNGWVTGMRFYQKGNRVGIQVKTSYQ